MVVFEGGAAKKSDYRKFSVKSTDGQNDVGAMREVLVRRFNRAKGGPAAGDYDPSFAHLEQRDWPVLLAGFGIAAAIAILRIALSAIALRGRLQRT